MHVVGYCKFFLMILQIKSGNKILLCIDVNRGEVEFIVVDVEC